MHARQNSKCFGFNTHKNPAKDYYYKNSQVIIRSLGV